MRLKQKTLCKMMFPAHEDTGLAEAEGYVHIPKRTDAATGVEGLLKPCLYDTAEKHLNTVWECG